MIIEEMNLNICQIEDHQEEDPLDPQVETLEEDPLDKMDVMVEKVDMDLQEEMVMMEEMDNLEEMEEMEKMVILDEMEEEDHVDYPGPGYTVPAQAIAPTVTENVTLGYQLN